MQTLEKFHQKQSRGGGRTNIQRFLWEDGFTKGKLSSLLFTLQFIFQ